MYIYICIYIFIHIHIYLKEELDTVLGSRSWMMEPAAVADELEGTCYSSCYCVCQSITYTCMFVYISG